MHLLDQLLVFARNRLRSIRHRKHQVSIRQRFHRLPDPNALGFVEGLPNAGRVYEIHRNSIKRDRLSHQVASGPRSCGHDRTLALHQPIEQTRLPHIRSADNCQTQALLQKSSRASSLRKFCQGGTTLLNYEVDIVKG